MQQISKLVPASYAAQMGSKLLLPRMLMLKKISTCCFIAPSVVVQPAGSMRDVVADNIAL